MEVNYNLSLTVKREVIDSLYVFKNRVNKIYIMKKKRIVV